MIRPCFIYAITHVASGKKYIGSSVTILHRWSDHRSDLRRNRHHCAHLQNAWNKYGEAAFAFSILKSLDTNDRQTRYAEELLAIAGADCYNSRKANLGATNFENCAETRSKIKAGIRKRISEDADHRAWLSERGKAIAEHARTPDRRAVRSVQSKEKWLDPAHRKSVSDALAIHWSTPGVREEHSDRVKLHRGTDEAKKKNSDTTAKLWADPNSGLRNRKQTRWADPEAKARQSEKMRAIWTKRRLLKQEQESRLKQGDA